MDTKSNYETLQDFAHKREEARDDTRTDREIQFGSKRITQERMSIRRLTSEPVTRRSTRIGADCTNCTKLSNVPLESELGTQTHEAKNHTTQIGIATQHRERTVADTRAERESRNRSKQLTSKLNTDTATQYSNRDTHTANDRHPRKVAHSNHTLTSRTPTDATQLWGPDEREQPGTT